MGSLTGRNPAAANLSVPSMHCMTGCYLHRIQQATTSCSTLCRGTYDMVINKLSETSVTVQLNACPIIIG